MPSELGKDVEAAVRLPRITLHFGRTSEVFDLEKIFDLTRLEERSPWGGSLMSYALNGQRTLDDLLAEFDEAAPGEPETANVA
ncbi:hypothetical protein R3P38DRAFT_3179797 [Favolaschia claudopus]|uniref:Uncharacterized protein n=1 Tax=Favolaschia claudopus TaxID=2862362 RepID=A0AAW0CTG2_9AGAR